MKKFWAVAVAAILGGSCLCGNVVLLGEATYCDDGIMPLAATDHYVYYESKTEDIYKMGLNHPYFSASSHLASCACVAGANVVGFFDRYDENLIPNHEAGIVFQGQFIYRSEDSAVSAVVDQLYTDMGTTNTGTSVEQFKNGMKAFCSRKGKNITFSSCMIGGQFNISMARSYMKAHYPVVLFCSGYNVSDIYTYDQNDHISCYESTGNHVMVGFGYMTVDYQLTSSSSAQYRYIKVASGVDGRPDGYYNIDYNTHIDDAIAINIY